MENKLIMHCSFGDIVIELNPDSNYKEAWIYVEKDGEVYQDLAIVRENYHYDDAEGCSIVHDGKAEVLVYADKDSEDYTDKFTIEMHEE